ncbi:MAG: metallophosphoesterase family protein [Anaerolineales bacterium]
MKVGVLSDTHDDEGNLKLALADYRQQGITQLIHCGDLIGPEIVGQLEGFQVIYVDGNMDRESGEIFRTLREVDPHSVVLPTFEGELAGISIAVTHGDDPAELNRVIRSGIHRFVFTGHTHRRLDETIGPTRVFNPGALGGLQFESRSYSVVDLASSEVEVIEL